MQLDILTRPGPRPDSPTMLFVHGAWHSSWCWKEKFFAAFDGYSLIAPSLRGHGASAGRERLKDWRLRDYVEDVASVAADLRASSGVDPIVVGHSMGAFVVLKYLEQHQAPTRILLSCPPLHGAFLAAMQFALAHPRPFAEANIGYLRHMRQGIPPLMPAGIFSPELPPAERDGYISRLQPESARVYSDVFFLDMPQSKRIKTPLLF
jgi:pimeloyl-ACP methyl ester carboxylesterase